MKLLALLTDAFGALGGIAQYNRDFLEALAASNQIETIHCVVRAGQAKEVPEKITQLAPINNKLVYSIKSIQQAISLNPDILFCGHINLLPLVSLIARITGTKIWLQIHGLDAWEKTSGITARQMENVAFVTSVSRYTRQQFLKWANLKPSTVKVLPNTIEPSDGEHNAVISSQKIILTVGRLSSSEQYKGQDRILNCLPELIKQQPDIHYIIAGDGDDKPRLQKLTSDLNIEEHVTFAGELNKEKLNQLYQQADLFAMPSTSEGFGIVYLEAMSHGTPALGLNKDGSRDPLQDGNLGIVATKETFCKEILKALNNKPDKELATQVQKTFGKKNFNQHVERLLTDVNRLPS